MSITQSQARGLLQQEGDKQQTRRIDESMPDPLQSAIKQARKTWEIFLRERQSDVTAVWWRGTSQVSHFSNTFVIVKVDVTNTFGK